MNPANIPSAPDTEDAQAQENGAAISKAGLALAAGCFLAAAIWSLAADVWTRLRSECARPGRSTPRIFRRTRKAQPNGASKIAAPGDGRTPASETTRCLERNLETANKSHQHPTKSPHE